MLLKDILKDAATLLKLNNVLNLLELGGSGQDEQAQKDLELLTVCVNLIINEIASEYVPLKTIEEVLVANSKIPYTNLKKPALNIKSIKDSSGQNRYFKVYPSYIYTDSQGACHIEYTYLPAKLKDLDEASEYQNTKVTSRIIAYGAAREYCLIMSMYEEAQSWDIRFKESLASACRKNNVLSIPKRLWR
ncbi:MAG TPA: hypothetical protein GX745_00660 [Clostridiales bacterium]|nr:hypothetical protein [Clostridiales bacterium]